MKPKKHSMLQRNILNLYRKAARFDALTSPVMEVLCGIAVAIILWYGGYAIVAGKTTPGALFAFLTAFFSAYRPYKSLSLIKCTSTRRACCSEKIISKF
jgi:ABC-type multidrug transport system fused ATPase/permease subunit